jgi:anti-sigma factor RsiW
MKESRPHALDAWDDRLVAFLDGSASNAERAAIEAHAVDCPICRRRLAALRTIDRDLHAAMAGESPGRAFDRAVLERIAVFERGFDARAAQDRIASMRRAEMAALESLRRRVRLDVVLDMFGAIGAAAVTGLIGLQMAGTFGAGIDAIRDAAGGALPTVLAAGTAVIALLVGTGYAVGRERGLL